VMGFCTEEQATSFLAAVPLVERAIIGSGVILLKYWLEISPEVQTKRLQERIDDPRKTWKLSGMDLRSYSRWFDYSRARDAMFLASDTSYAPWYVVHADDGRRARLNIISHLLKQVPYKRLPTEKIKLPSRQKAGGYVEPRHPLRHVPDRY